MKRGSVTDRPWGLTLGALIAERATGELVVIAEGKRYAIAFHDGAIVWALSPGAADSVGRIALTSHLVSSTQVAEIMRRIAAQPERDEIEVIAEVARLSAAKAETLRRRVLTQRAARTFAIEHGTFAFDDKIPIHLLPTAGSSIDARTAIYLGARMHLAEPRLANELRLLGTRFALRLDAMDELPRFGFTDAERPILEALRSGTSVAELEAKHRELDPRVIAAVVYTLACCGACADAAQLQAHAPSTPPREREDAPPASPPVVAIPVVSRTMTPQPMLATGSSPGLKRPSVQIPPLSRTMTPQPEELPGHVHAPTKDRTPERLDARDAFQRGEMAMRRDQLSQAIVEFARAVLLQPHDADFLATLAWAKFCAAPDKQAVAEDTRAAIDRAIAQSAESVTARMYRGRVERMLGGDEEALGYFQQVLTIQPRHSAAASEARILESRLGR